MKQQLITMTQKELSRYEIIQNLIDGHINGTEASKQIRLIVRQVKNIKAAVIKEGAKGIIHKNRGRESNRKIPETKIRKIKEIIQHKYCDFGPIFATEKLHENHKLIIGKEKLRQLMIEWGLRRVKLRKQSKKHFWRPRKDNYGEMQQFDGSYHYWLENRCEELCLLLSIDDTTGKITHAKFDYNEGVNAVFKFWMEYFTKNGLPKFNTQFTVIPNTKANLHREINNQLREKLPQIFARQSPRKVNNDYTIMFESKYFQLNLERPTTVYKKDMVNIEEHLNGDIKISLKGHYFNYTVLLERPKKIINIKLSTLTQRKQLDWKPPS